MKKIFFGMVALVAMVATSCQQTPDLAEVGLGGEAATVEFNLGTPQISNRAVYSNGEAATHLQWAVYDANGNILNDLTGEKKDFQLSTTVKFQLTTGNTYYVLFWAAAEGAPYTVDLEAKTMEVDYTGAVSNDEKRDAFYYYDDFTVANGMDPIKAELKRPFAQLNIGTDDFAASEKAGHKVTHAMVEVPAYSKLNFADGVVEGKAVRTFAYAAVPGSAYEFPVNDTKYDYIAMNYLLMANTKETVDVKFTYAKDATGANAKTRTVGSVPVCRNYRTNLYGQLFTSDATVNVTINKEYDDAYNVDGIVFSSVTVPANNTEDVVLNTETVKVSVPASEAQAGDIYEMVVSNESIKTDSTTGETTASFDLVLYKNNVKVSGNTTVYNVDWNIGAGKIVSGVTHNGTALTKATTGADQTYTYDSATGILTIYTASFSPFAVNYVDLKETFADNSWNNIALACQNNTVPATWNVGDKKEMTIGGSTYDVAIIGKNHDVYSDGTGVAPLTFQLTEVYGSAAMNATQTNATGWSGSKMRNTTMVEALAAMPTEVQNAIKAVDKLTLKGDASGLETTSDKLFLLSLFECYGSTFYSNGYEEGSKYEYYTSIDKRIMNATWWLRGPGVNNGKNNGIGFTQISMSGYMANGSAEYASGVIFGFCF